MPRFLKRRSRRHVSLTDIAREAGVSTATVSRVINNRGNIAEATRENRAPGRPPASVDTQERQLIDTRKPAINGVRPGR